MAKHRLYEANYCGGEVSAAETNSSEDDSDHDGDIFTLVTNNRQEQWCAMWRSAMQLYWRDTKCGRMAIDTPIN